MAAAKGISNKWLSKGIQNHSNKKGQWQPKNLHFNRTFSILSTMYCNQSRKKSAISFVLFMYQSSRQYMYIIWTSKNEREENEVEIEVFVISIFPLCPMYFHLKIATSFSSFSFWSSFFIDTVTAYPLSCAGKSSLYIRWHSFALKCPQKQEPNFS